MPFCKKCDGFMYSVTTCWCKPYEIKDECNRGDDIKVIYDRCPEGAAEKYAKCFNEDTEYSLLNGCPLEVFVNGEKYTVTAEPSVQYDVEKSE